MTSRERVQAVLRGEQPDRVPYVDVGIDFPFVCRLLEREVPGGRFFDSGEYETTPIELQLAVNALLRRDNLAYHMAPPIPAHKVPGQDQILFLHDGYPKTWGDLKRLTFPDLQSEGICQISGHDLVFRAMSARRSQSRTRREPLKGARRRAGRASGPKIWQIPGIQVSANFASGGSALGSRSLRCSG